MTQCERILRHIEDCGKINQLDAMKEYGIMRLASRICDLRKQGFPIGKRMIVSTNRYGETVSYAEYYWERKEEKDNAQNV